MRSGAADASTPGGSSAWLLRSVTVGGPSTASSKGISPSGRRRGASDIRCALPSKTVLQCPQRTCPARIANCCGVTRKIVLQPGQRVYCS